MAKIKNLLIEIEELFTEENMTIEQIAKQLNITEKEVKIFLKYALA